MHRSLVVALLVSATLTGCLGDATLDPSSTPQADPSPDEAVDPGWPPLEEALVRPGAKLYDRTTDQLGITDEPLTDVHYYLCSTNFVFKSPDNATLYLGTASHCVTGFSVGDRIPVADGRANATLAYCSYGTIAGTPNCPDLTNDTESSHPNDFALLAVDPADRHKVHPAVHSLGGPTHLATEAYPGDEAWTYGNTDLRDAGQRQVPDHLDARPGRVHSQNDWTTRLFFDPASLPGDSGSLAVTADGGALGVVQWLGLVGCPGERPDMVGVVNLDRALWYMEEHTDLRVELATWPLLEAPTLPPAPEGSCVPSGPLS